MDSNNLYQIDQSNNPALCNPDVTLWMGDLKTDWDANFIKEAFRHFSHEIQNVKTVTDRSGRVCFNFIVKKLNYYGLNPTKKLFYCQDFSKIVLALFEIYIYFSKILYTFLKSKKK